MDKKSKEAMRRYKKKRQATESSSDDSSSSSDSDSESSSYSSESDQKASQKLRRKAARHAAAVAEGAVRRSSSSSAEERRKRQKREHCQKKLEAKRDQLKRKLKEARLKKRAADAAAVLSGHSHRPLSPTTLAKLKKLADRKHQRVESKEGLEREREKEKLRAREKAREHHHHLRVSSRSPGKTTKIRIHQEAKRLKSPQRMHQLLTREKIIIQTRGRERTPSAERERHRQESLHGLQVIKERDRRDRDKERIDRESAREKERAEALERCRERQRERERLAREKMRREEEEKYGSTSERYLQRFGERSLAEGRGYNSRERSMDPADHARHMSAREREYLEAERERRSLLSREELRREREYLTPSTSISRRRDISPIGDHYATPRREPRSIYPEEERERPFNRSYHEDGRIAPREREPWMDSRNVRDMELHDLHEVEHPYNYSQERECHVREREPPLTPGSEWKNEWVSPRERDWDLSSSGRGGLAAGHKRGGVAVSGHTKIAPREQRTPSEPDWDADEVLSNTSNKKGSVGKAPFSGSEPRDSGWNESPIAGVHPEHVERRWLDTSEGLPSRAGGIPPSLPPHHHRGERGGRGYRGRGGGIALDHSERKLHGSSYRSHPPALMTLPVHPPGGFHGATTRFPNKRSMTYTNPNIIKKQQAALAATAVAAVKAAAQSAANATTNPSILGQTKTDGVEGGEMAADCEEVTGGEIEAGTAAKIDVDRMSGELSEISDSDDDILNVADKKQTIPEAEVCLDRSRTDVAAVDGSEDVVNKKGRPEDDEMLDFEEISDGELEEDARNKGVGDALGVDWASLIAETNRQAKEAAPSLREQPTSAKQKWQAHRVILDMGISMRMASKPFAERIFSVAQQKLKEELGVVDIKSEVKMEEGLDGTDEQSVYPCKPLQENALPGEDEEDFNIESLHPLACVQVGKRKRRLEHSRLLLNACGPHSRALSFRQDLQLRRQLCGLPAFDHNLPQPLPTVSAKLKAMALANFQRAIQVN